jgi:hypothetical protein
MWVNNLNKINVSTDRIGDSEDIIRMQLILSGIKRELTVFVATDE